MGRGRAATAKWALEQFLARTGGEADWERALRALTLFMVKGHAPRFFGRHQLADPYAAAVARLGPVPRTLPEWLPAIDGMSRIDAAWVEWADGRAPALPDREQARAYLLMAHKRDGALWAWVMSELLVQMGHDCRFTLPGAASGEPPSEEEELYRLTHDVLLWSRYLSRPVSPGAFPEAVLRLQGAAGAVLVVKQFDLLAELAFCLQALGADFEPAMGFEAEANERGQLGKETGYSGAHELAAGLVALAGALER